MPMRLRGRSCVLVFSSILIGVTLGCGGGGASGGGTTPPPVTPPATSTHIIAAFTKARVPVLGGTTWSSPLEAQVLDASEHPVVGAKVTFTLPAGATVTPATATTDSNGKARAFVTFPNLALQTFTLQVTADGGGTASVQLQTGPRVISVFGDASVGSSVSSDGRVAGKDLLGPDGTLAVRSGVAVMAASLPEGNISNLVRVGFDGKVYLMQSGLLQVLDDHMRLQRVVDLLGLTAGRTTPIRTTDPTPWVDAAGNLYLPKLQPVNGWETVEKYANDGTFISSTGVMEVGIHYQDGAVTPNGTAVFVEPQSYVSAVLHAVMPNGDLRQATVPASVDAIAAGANNNIYVSNLTFQTTYVYNSSLTLLSTVQVKDLNGSPLGLTVIGADAAGNLYWKRTGNSESVVKTDAAGSILWVSAGFPDELKASSQPADPRYPPMLYPNAARGFLVNGGAGAPVYFRDVKVAKYVDGAYAGLAFSLTGSETLAGLAATGGKLVAVVQALPGYLIRTYDADGTLLSSNSRMVPLVGGIAVAGDGTIYSIDFSTGLLQIVAPDGTERVIGTALRNSNYAFTLGPDGNLVVVASALSKMSPSGTVLWTTQVTGPAPASVAVDSKNRVWMCTTAPGYNDGIAIYDGAAGSLLNLTPLDGDCLVGGAGDAIYLRSNGRVYQVSAE